MIQIKDREIGAGWAEKRETSETWNGQRREKLQKLGMASSRRESLINIEAQQQVNHQPP